MGVYPRSFLISLAPGSSSKVHRFFRRPLLFFHRYGSFKFPTGYCAVFSDGADLLPRQVEKVCATLLGSLIFFFSYDSDLLFITWHFSRNTAFLRPHFAPLGVPHLPPRKDMVPPSPFAFFFFMKEFLPLTAVQRRLTALRKAPFSHFGLLRDVPLFPPLDLLQSLGAARRRRAGGGQSVLLSGGSQNSSQAFFRCNIPRFRPSLAFPLWHLLPRSAPIPTRIYPIFGSPSLYHSYLCTRAFKYLGAYHPLFRLTNKITSDGYKTLRRSVLCGILFSCASRRILRRPPM